MSTLQVANVHLESTGNNRIQYTGSNTITIYAGGAAAAVVNSTGFGINSFSGNVSFDTNTLFVDSANNRVGIGRTNPQYPLDVSGSIRGHTGLIAGPNVVNISMTYQSNNTFSNGLNIYKRGTTGDSNAAVTLGSEVGYHSFFAYNGSGYNRGAYVIVNTAEDITTANGGMHYRIFTAPIGSNTALERFRITSEGNIGIGNTSPTHKLRVEGDTSFNGAIDEKVYNLTGTAIDPSNGTIQYKEIGSNVTLTDSISEGESVTVMIKSTSPNDTVTWPTTTWVNNGKTAPTTITGDWTVVELWKVGATLYGALVGDGS